MRFNTDLFAENSANELRHNFSIILISNRRQQIYKIGRSTYLRMLGHLGLLEKLSNPKMGWYFLSEYKDFYRPGDPYGIVKWFV